MSNQYPTEARAALEELYSVHSARLSQPQLTLQMKIYVLDSELGGSSNFYASGGPLTDEIKVECLELQYLELKGLVKLELA